MDNTVNLDEITDGKFYMIDDLVAADTGGCVNCSACCHGVGDLVVLTPYDVYEMSRYLDLTFEKLCSDKIELHSHDKIVLPHLKMHSESEKCTFLSDKGWCEIHACRPNICRLFPLGRVYDEADFKFFLQTNVCVKPNLTPIKVADWIGIKNYDENKKFLLTWHQLLKALNFRAKFIRDEQEIKDINAYLVDVFFRLSEGGSSNFYEAFYAILPEAKNRLGII